MVIQRGKDTDGATPNQKTQTAREQERYAWPER